MLSTDIRGRIQGWWDDEPIKSWFARMAVRYDGMVLHGNMRRFFVARQGGTGSVWLAKVLNAHPDVLCSHEAVIGRTLPATSHSDEDITGLIESLALNSCHGAYAAAGDIGSVWVGHAVIAPPRLFSAGVLVRHPARMLHTRLTRTRSGIGDRSSADLANVERFFEISASSLDREDALFLNDCLFWCATAYCVPPELIIRLEDISADVSALAALCRRLTGIDYSTQLLTSLTLTRINASADLGTTIDACLAAFTPRQRHWYGQFIEPALSAAGYGEQAPPPERRSRHLGAADGPPLRGGASLAPGRLI